MYVCMSVCMSYSRDWVILSGVCIGIFSFFAFTHCWSKFLIIFSNGKSKNFLILDYFDLFSISLTQFINYDWSMTCSTHQLRPKRIAQKNETSENSSRPGTSTTTTTRTTVHFKLFRVLFEFFSCRAAREERSDARNNKSCDVCLSYSRDWVILSVVRGLILIFFY